MKTTRTDVRRPGSGLAAAGLLMLVSFVVSNGVLAQDTRIARDTIETTSGKLSGAKLDDGVTVFRGIPFAAPPVGELRWRPPQPPAKWDGVRKCEQFGDVAWQSMKGRTNPPAMNEDCLYLNVWSGNVGGETKRPVMVWIHGGGLNQGWSSQAKYDGTAFAKEGVVFVSVNYRLGALGFLAHPSLSKESPDGVSGNYGLLDQIESLKWVRDNIARFGGDRDNVTIFGESAGGTSVAALCASPLAKGLFHRAILQSPWMFGYINQLAEPNIVPLRHSVSTTVSAEELGEQWASGFVDDGGDDAIAKLRSMPADKFVVGQEYYKTRVTVDGWFLPDYPSTVFTEGKQADVPMMIGTTKDEGNYFTYFVPERPTFEANLREHYGSSAEQLLELYPGDTKQAQKRAVSRFITDAWFVRPARQLLNGMNKVSSKAFQYQFVHGNRKLPALGSPHAIELKYVFGTLDENATPADRSVSQTMIRYWSQFAKTGDPNTDGLTPWPAYGDEASYLKIGVTCETDHQLAKETCDALDRANEQRLKSIPSAADTVQTQSGLISGVPVEGAESIRILKGIPFAAPPVGNLRWKPPQPPTSWNGVGVCDEFGNKSLQKVKRNRQGPFNEDGLYLNVPVPDGPPLTRFLYAFK